MKSELCQEASQAKVRGRVIAKDILIELNGKKHLVAVTTPEFLALQSDPSQFLIVDDLSNIEEICRKIREKPFEELKPYLSLSDSEK